MQNPGQTQIFYKPCLTHLTRTKMTQMTWMTQPGFNPDCHSGINQNTEEADLLETKLNYMKDGKVCVDKIKL